MAETARDLEQMLRRHYLPENRPAGGLFATEIGSPDGKRRADAIWCPTTIAGGTEIVGHEIKVTRADVAVELSDPTKAEPWAQYCTRWWLVVADPALVDGLTVPDAWGIMSPPSGRRTRSMTVVRPAPRLQPKDPAAGFRRLLTWHLYRATDEISEAKRTAEYREAEAERLRAQLRQAQLAGGSRHPQAQRVAEIITAAEKQVRGEALWCDVEDQTVVAAIVDATATRDAARRTRIELTQATNNARRLTQPLEQVVADLERATRIAEQVAS